MLHEPSDRVVGIIGITDRVRATEQHLETDVRDAFAQRAQSQPRVFMQETQRRVERRAAPHLHAVKIRRAPRDRIRHREHVVSPHPRGEE